MLEEDVRPYLAEYPRLIATLASIARQVAEGDAGPVALMALFGSVARLEPGMWSDADLLVLYAGHPSAEDLHTFSGELLHLIRGVEERMVDEHYRWPITPLWTDEDASDLDPDFIANVGAHGILLYQRPGTEPPPALARLRPFEAWVRREERMMGEATRTTG